MKIVGRTFYDYSGKQSCSPSRPCRNYRHYAPNRGVSSFPCPPSFLLRPPPMQVLGIFPSFSEGFVCQCLGALLFSWARTQTVPSLQSSCRQSHRFAEGGRKTSLNKRASAGYQRRTKRSPARNDRSSGMYRCNYNLTQGTTLSFCVSFLSAFFCFYSSGERRSDEKTLDVAED